MLLEIKDRYSGRVIFSYDVKNNTMLGTVKAALAIGANLRGADLRGAYLGNADLGGADLRGANLGSANLGGANLRGANLRGADLRGANLYGADLRGANLYGANLRGADLGGKKLSGDRPFFQIGPIGSRIDYLLAFTTDSGIVLKAGCFTGSIDEFESSLDETHKSNNHAQEYRAALVLIRAHAELWPADKTEEKAAA